jgi:Flp pilus assembly protein TadG
MKRIGFLKDEKGSALIITALCMTVILGFCALVVDIGLTAEEKGRLGNAVDAAALAGAQELINNPENAGEVARLYLEKNNIDPLDYNVEVFDSNTKIKVTAKMEVNYFFADILGFDKTDVNSAAVAECAPLSGVYSGTRPFAIERQELDFGQTYTLKEGGGGGSDGNYGALALGGNGAANYQVNIVSGYAGYLNVGDNVYTEPGNMSGPTLQGITTLISQCTHLPQCTYESYNPDCSRLITVVMIDSLDVSGSKPVSIVGFAKFFLEGVSGSGNDSIVTGRFEKMLSDGIMSNTQTPLSDFGLMGIRLIQ